VTERGVPRGTGIGRRDALRLIGAAPLAVYLGVGAARAEAAGEHAARAVQAAARGEAAAPRFFTAHEWETLRVLVDLILPRDERSGAATDAGVPEFIDFLMSDPEEEDRALERRQTAMRGGLAWIDAECRRRSGGSFLEASERERRSLLDDIAYAAPGEDGEEGAQDPPGPRARLRQGTAFFASLRDLTAAGFWSSAMGTQDLGYVGNRFEPDWQGPPPEVLRRIGVLAAGGES
jgi:hypothetical protein